jgi:hypothetical protein
MWPIGGIKPLITKEKTMKTLENFLNETRATLRPYGTDGSYLVLIKEIPSGSFFDLYHLIDYVVSAAISGPGYIMSPRTCDLV